jgi:hypothetical protein
LVETNRTKMVLVLVLVVVVVRVLVLVLVTIYHPSTRRPYLRKKEVENGLGGVFDSWSLLDLWYFQSVDAVSSQQDGRTRDLTG